RGALYARQVGRFFLVLYVMGVVVTAVVAPHDLVRFHLHPTKLVHALVLSLAFGVWWAVAREHVRRARGAVRPAPLRVHVLPGADQRARAHLFAPPSSRARRSGRCGWARSRRCRRSSRSTGSRATPSCPPDHAAARRPRHGHVVRRDGRRHRARVEGNRRAAHGGGPRRAAPAVYDYRDVGQGGLGAVALARPPRTPR